MRLECSGKSSTVLSSLVAVLSSLAFMRVECSGKSSTVHSSLVAGLPASTAYAIARAHPALNSHFYSLAEPRLLLSREGVAP